MSEKRGVKFPRSLKVRLSKEQMKKRLEDIAHRKAKREAERVRQANHN